MSPPPDSQSPRLAQVVEQLEEILTCGSHRPPQFAPDDIRRETWWVRMRDGIRLATDVYLPPKCPAPVIATRTPYGRTDEKLVGALSVLARFGYAVVAQDCRGTGDSEPDSWDYYIYESEDSLDLVEWVIQRPWFDGFLGGCGGSYAGQTSWCMAVHPRMSTIVPEVSGLGVACNTAHLHMFVNAYARSVGKGKGRVPIHHSRLEQLMLEETLASGYFNEPLHRPFAAKLLARYPQLSALPPAAGKRWLWHEYCKLPSAQRAAMIKEALGTSTIGILEVESLMAVFGHRVPHDAHTLPFASSTDACRALRAPFLMITGWYDWGLNDALASWEQCRRHALDSVRSGSRLIITPSAHNKAGYHEGDEIHSELRRSHRLTNQTAIVVAWYEAVRERRLRSWPTVIYYLMGANEWRVATDWPPPQARTLRLYLGSDWRLTLQPSSSLPDVYTYEPEQPTPTVGGSIVSHVYPVGSVDVSDVQGREDVLVYTTGPLTQDLDVVGPLRLILYASSTTVDTDFCARLSDVFPDGRAIQLQNGILRARYRNSSGDPELLVPGNVYQLEIDLWATANRFKAGHRVRLDLSSADFPRFDRNCNRGGEPGPPLAATQTIYHDAERPSQLLISVFDPGAAERCIPD